MSGLKSENFSSFAKQFHAKTKFDPKFRELLRKGETKLKWKRWIRFNSSLRNLERHFEACIRMAKKTQILTID